MYVLYKCNTHEVGMRSNRKGTVLCSLFYSSLLVHNVNIIVIIHWNLNFFCFKPGYTVDLKFGNSDNHNDGPHISRESQERQKQHLG